MEDGVNGRIEPDHRRSELRQWQTSWNVEQSGIWAPDRVRGDYATPTSDRTFGT